MTCALEPATPAATACSARALEGAAERPRLQGLWRRHLAALPVLVGGVAENQAAADVRAAAAQHVEHVGVSPLFRVCGDGQLDVFSASELAAHLALGAHVVQRG